MLRVKAKVPDEFPRMSALGLQELHETIAEDYFLSEQDASCCEFKHQALSLA